MDEYTFSKVYKIANLLKDSNLVNSTSEAFRMIKQGAVKMDGEKINDKDLISKSRHLCLSSWQKKVC
jgi:tyrosyl-tRNA synthetase